VGLAGVACSASTQRAGFDDADAGGSTSGSSGTSGESTSGGFVGADGGPKIGADGCSDAAKLVYVLSLEGDLYSFAPAEKKFTKVGPLDCKLGGKKLIPISMAVDRQAVAWVNMREDDPFGLGEDTLFKVDTQTATCSPTNIKGSMGGMGFSTDANGTPAPGQASNEKETLFVIGEGSPGKGALRKVDFAQEKLVTVSDLAEQSDLELTGTGDGRLYGFLITRPLALAAIDKSTTMLSGRVTLGKVETPLAPMFAFSFWGGDFYFYTATSTTSSKTTNVARYRPSDGSVEPAYMSSIGFHVVGAGVSTCAPTTAPK
jgi:hypothetical protein